MTETAAIGTTLPRAPVQWRRADPRTGLDQRMLSSDPIVHHLRVCLQTARAKPSEMSFVCADHVASALNAYLGRAHNIVVLPQPTTSRGGLAPWQLRRAKEILVSHLDKAVPLADLASTCKLSPGHFARAFKQTTGKPPHRWLMEKRIEKAQELLVSTRLPLVDIAITCGFADQSHFTRVFTRSTQSSPGAWRRHRQTVPPAA